jgi:hypothetical protein
MAIKNLSSIAVRVKELQFEIASFIANPVALRHIPEPFVGDRRHRARMQDCHPCKQI